MHSLKISFFYCPYWPEPLNIPHPSPYVPVDIYMNSHLPYPLWHQRWRANVPMKYWQHYQYSQGAKTQKQNQHQNTVQFIVLILVLKFSDNCKRQYWQLMKSYAVFLDCFNYVGGQLCVFNTDWCKLPDMCCSVSIKIYLCTCCPDTVTEKLHTYSVKATTSDTSCEK
jgi:hypothetical protein